MNNPGTELADVVKKLTMSASPAAQHAAVTRYFHPDAGFHHLLCIVVPGPDSRERILSIYQWYRDMSPHLELEVNSVVYDSEQMLAFLDITQSFHMFWSLLKPHPARLVTKITLQKSQGDGKFYIIQQEDFYQPEDILYLTIPFLGAPLVMAKRLTAEACVFNAAAFGYLRIATHQCMQFLGLAGQKEKSDHQD